MLKQMAIPSDLIPYLYGQYLTWANLDIIRMPGMRTFQLYRSEFHYVERSLKETLLRIDRKWTIWSPHIYYTRP